MKHTKIYIAASFLGVIYLTNPALAESANDQDSNIPTPQIHVTNIDKYDLKPEVSDADVDDDSNDQDQDKPQINVGGIVDTGVDSTISVLGDI